MYGDNGSFPSNVSCLRVPSERSTSAKEVNTTDGWTEDIVSVVVILLALCVRERESTAEVVRAAWTLDPPGRSP